MRLKSKLVRQAACMLVLILGAQSLFASGTGSVMGRVTDPDTKAPAADVIVVFENQGAQRTFVTNDSGYYYASNLPVGIYNVTASYMSNLKKVVGFVIGEDDQKVLDLDLSAAIQGGTVFIDGTPVNPMIDPLGGEKVKLSRDDFKNEPITKVDDITAQQPGITEVNGVFYVKGAREGALTYYIDGAPVMARADIPLCGLETYTIYTGFIPPKYGDSVGGVVVMETRNFFSESH